MKRLVFFIAILFTALAGAQVINIPDANFKNALVTSAVGYNQVAKDSSGDFIAVDANADGQISQAEAEEVRELYIANKGITFLTGIAYFTDLSVLDVTNNNLSAFDATPLQDLEELYIGYNQLTSLTIAGSHDLEILECNNNQLTTVDFSNMEYLVGVNCADNNLTTLDFSGCHYLSQLDCANNNLEYIGLKNGITQTSSFTYNQWGNNPNLAYICIDEAEEAVVNSLLAANGYTTVVANSFCTFTPGGDYNTIKGKLTYDADGDGCSTTDPSQKFIKVTTTIGSETCAVFTDVNGQYELYTLAGSFTVIPQFENNYFTATPSAGAANFQYVNNSEAYVDFCVTPDGSNPDIEIVMVPVVEAVPGQDAVYKMVYKNKGNQILSGAVNCTWDYTKFNFNANSFVPVTDDIQVNGNLATYIWDYTDLQPFESREITITLGVHSATDAVPVNVDDVLTFDAQATFAGDVLVTDNSHVLAQRVAAVNNPASITCIEGETAPVTYIGEYLHYVVNFTNQGTQTANNVVVEMDLDPNHFDISTLQVLNSSHTANARVAGGNARFAMLSAAIQQDGHGTILFKAKTKNNLMPGTTVFSNARIYFDYDAAVNTNVAATEFDVMGTDKPITNTVVSVYPNPAQDVVNVTADTTIQAVNLYDIQGRLLETVLVNNTQVAVDVSGRAAGVYFVKVVTAGGSKVQKIIKK